MKVREPGLSIKSPQAHRCFSAHLSLRRLHHFAPVYMKVREPGLSIKSRIFISSRLHDKWGDHMRDYTEMRVTSPTWGPLPSCKQALKRLEQAMFISEAADKLYHQVCALLVMDSWSYMASTFHFAAPETSYEQPLTMTKFSLYLL